MEENEFFSEYVFFDNSEEFGEAMQYLSLWVKFFMKGHLDYQLIDQQIIIKSEIPGSPRSTVAVKICLRKKEANEIHVIS